MVIAGDTASNLGNAMDELMRHQPSLRTDATKAIIKLLEEVCAMGRDAKYICPKPQPKAEQPASVTLRASLGNEATSSDDEDEEDEVGSTHSSSTAKQSDTAQGSAAAQSPQDAIQLVLRLFTSNTYKLMSIVIYPYHLCAL